MINMILIFALVLNGYLAYSNASECNPLFFVNLIGMLFAFFGLVI